MTITNHLDTMIKGLILSGVAALEDAAVVVEEGNSGDDDGEGTSGESRHCGQGIVAVNLNVTVEVGEENVLGTGGGSAGEVLAEVRNVGPHPLFGDTLVGGDVVVSELMGGAVAAARSTALLGILNA